MVVDEFNFSPELFLLEDLFRNFCDIKNEHDNTSYVKQIGESMCSQPFEMSEKW